jgi:uncharacterized protein (DUF924 family)
MAEVASVEDVLSFWFPDGRSISLDALRNHYAKHMRGGADTAILTRFTATLEAACAGELDHWARTARGRLALIVVLDQFSRTCFKNTPRMYAQDARAVELVLEGLDNGHFDALTDPDEKVFFLMPFGHSESRELHERASVMARAIADQSPVALRPLYEFSVSQAETACDVIRRFGRFPHRNAILGRDSSPAELEYLASETPTHLRPLPS